MNTAPERQERLKRLSEHIAQRRGNLTASEAARFIARSTSWTRHQFTPHMGMTFRHACLTAKLAYGEALLRTTQLKISDIATQLGYSERAKFETSFKRCYGLTPAVYRRSLPEAKAGF